MLPSARIKSSPEDFVVEEIPAYEPSGEGSHLFLRFTKRNKTTDEAVRSIGRALAADIRDIGVAGLKDKVAVTTQTISVPVPRAADGGTAFIEEARGLALDGIAIHGARRHAHKLKTGHLAGNRFAIVVRGIAPAKLDEVVAALERIGREGLPNAFGVQRFGRAGDNASRAREWLARRVPAPRDRRLRRLLWSALQAEVFNAVLDARVRDGTWASPLLGDLVKRRTSGGLFLCADVQVDAERASAGEVSPTGPIVGAKMRWPEGAPGALEHRIASAMLGENFDFDATRAIGEGARRALRLWVEDLRVVRGTTDESGPREEQADGVRVYFVLPKGAYATTVLSAAVAWEQQGQPTPEKESENE